MKAGTHKDKNEIFC